MNLTISHAHRNTHTHTFTTPYPLHYQRTPAAAPFFLSCHTHLTPLHQLSLVLHFPAESNEHVDWKSTRNTHHTVCISGCRRSHHISSHHHPSLSSLWFSRPHLRHWLSPHHAFLRGATSYRITFISKYPALSFKILDQKKKKRL